MFVDGYFCVSRVSFKGTRTFLENCHVSNFLPFISTLNRYPSRHVHMRIYLVYLLNIGKISANGEVKKIKMIRFEFIKPLRHYVSWKMWKKIPYIKDFRLFLSRISGSFQTKERKRSEAVVPTFCLKNVFWKVLYNLPENIFKGTLFVSELRATTLQVFLPVNFMKYYTKNSWYYGTPASANFWKISHQINKNMRCNS